MALHRLISLNLKTGISGQLRVADIYYEKRIQGVYSVASFYDVYILVHLNQDVWHKLKWKLSRTLKRESKANLRLLGKML